MPPDWTIFRSHEISHQQLDAMSNSGSSNPILECLPFDFLYPASWSIRPDPLDKRDRLAIRRILVPDGSLELTEEGGQVISPAFQLIGASTPSPTADALFNHWERPTAGAGFRDYHVQESERMTLSGDQMLARVFDFSRTSGRWRSLMTLRWGNGCFYFFDISGRIEDVEARRSGLVPVLASLRWYKSLRSFVNASGKRR
jgi:hypothetical protein